MSEQLWASAAVRDRMGGCRRLRDRRTGPARELLALVLDHFPLARNELQRLGHVLADLAQAAVTAARADECAVDCFLVRTAFPKGPEGSRIVTFEAFSGFAHVTAHRIAQSPKATFSTRLQPGRLPSRAARQLRINRQLSGWNLPPLMIRAFTTHGHKATFGFTEHAIECRRKF
jgi:hypothetical protein